MYPNVKPVHQRLRPIHPKKFVSIKAEVEKLLHASFIYPVPLTEWVSNIIPIMKKKGTIRVCIDYRDVNISCPKENYLSELYHPSIKNFFSNSLHINAIDSE